MKKDKFPIKKQKETDKVNGGKEGEMNTPIRVLIVEDSEEDAFLLVRELRRGGYDPVFERVDTPEGMAVALEKQLWDIVISDYVMPHFSGLAALKLLKTSGLDLPFIIVSGSIGEDVAVEAMKSGAQDYLMKNNLARLVPAIQQELREAEMRQKLKHSEKALQEAEKRYRQVVENATEIIYAVDEKGNFTYGNPAGLKVTGYSLQELRQFNYADLVLPEHRERVSQAYINQFQERWPTSYIEFPFFSKAGKILWFGQNTSLVIEDGKVVGFHVIARDITERKQAEEALRQAEENFRRSLDDSPLGVRIVTTEGETIYANRAILDIYGYDSIEELRTTPIKKRYTPESYAEFNIRKEKRQRGEYYPPEYEVSIVRKNGEIRDLQIFRKEILWNGGRQFQTIYQDITERRQAEEAIRKSEERFRELYDNAPVGYFEYDTQGRITRVNQTELQILGYAPEEMIGQPVWKFMVEEEIARQQILTKLAGTMPPARGLERNYKKKDGTIVPVLIEDRILRDPQGRITCIRCTLQDITDRKKADEALRRSEEKHRTILENIEEGYFEVDIAGNFTFYNDSMCRILGYSRDEVMGMNNRQYTDQENAKKLFQAFNKVYRTGEPTREFDWEIIRKDGGKRSIEASVSLIKDSSGNRIGFRGIVRDITERKRSEEERATLQEQLRQSQKIEAIGQLAGGVAHDFNNILTVIKGTCQLSLLDLDERNPMYGNLKEIERSAERAAGLTRQLLAFSRKQILEMQVLDLNQVIQSLDKMLHRIIGEDIGLVTFFAEELGRVKADPGQMEQVIINLSVNARDAMPRGGKLTIETANVELDEEYAKRHIAVKPGPYLMLSISDTGVGMTPEVKERLFEPFFTTKEMGKGTGLGLSTVYGIVKQSGGNIWVYSEPGQGTTFKIYLPQVDEPLEELREEVVREIPHGGETVLVVEDEETVRKLAVRILKRQGYKVLEAEDGGKAFMLCEKYKEPVHLILTDVVMPGMSGRELVERLQKIHPEAKALYMSGYTDNVILHHGILEKGIEFISKPFTLESLARKVREALDK
ncbi:MAG: PAS domain S-box protein [Deltaproteobacteria bacterium]|nr:PAS domain S-box protein [Deltaproteobacteria bacterium]